MKPIVIFGTIIVHLALLSYGAGIIVEQVKHKVTRFVLVFLGLGLLFDVVATVCMIIGSGRGFITTHGLLGYSCLLVMAVDSVLVFIHYFKNGTQRVSPSLHLFSRYAFTWWVVGAYITGGLIAYMRVSSSI
jgi:hypothetical protein